MAACLFTCIMSPLNRHIASKSNQLECPKDPLRAIVSAGRRLYHASASANRSASRHWSLHLAMAPHPQRARRRDGTLPPWQEVGSHRGPTPRQLNCTCTREEGAIHKRCVIYCVWRPNGAPDAGTAPENCTRAKQGRLPQPCLGPTWRFAKSRRLNSMTTFNLNWCACVSSDTIILARMTTACVCTCAPGQWRRRVRKVRLA